MSTSFFHHVAAEFAIRNGWDFEKDIRKFHEDNKTDLTSEYLAVEYKATGEVLTLTEQDVLDAAYGKYTENFKKFWKFVKLKEDATDLGVVLQSMHSGSSDYLYIKDVKELQKL